MTEPPSGGGIVQHHSFVSPDSQDVCSECGWPEENHRPETPEGHRFSEYLGPTTRPRPVCWCMKPESDPIHLPVLPQERTDAEDVPPTPPGNVIAGVLEDNDPMVHNDYPAYEVAHDVLAALSAEGWEVESKAVRDADRAFYALTVQQRDAAWREIEALRRRAVTKRTGAEDDEIWDGGYKQGRAEGFAAGAKQREAEIVAILRDLLKHDRNGDVSWTVRQAIAAIGADRG